MSRENTEPLVFPPDILGTTLVMRDAKSAFALAAFEPPIAEQGPEDDLDLHRIRHDPPQNALWILPHDMNVGTGLRLYAPARRASATSSTLFDATQSRIASARSTPSARPCALLWPSMTRPAHQTRTIADCKITS